MRSTDVTKRQTHATARARNQNRGHRTFVRRLSGAQRVVVMMDASGRVDFTLRGARRLSSANHEVRGHEPACTSAILGTISGHRRRACRARTWRARVRAGPREAWPSKHPGRRTGCDVRSCRSPRAGTPTRSTRPRDTPTARSAARDRSPRARTPRPSAAASLPRNQRSVWSSSACSSRTPSTGPGTRPSGASSCLFNARRRRSLRGRRTRSGFVRFDSVTSGGGNPTTRQSSRCR